MHQEWREEQDEIGDAHYIADPRDDKKLAQESSLQERILACRAEMNIPAPTFGKKRHGQHGHSHASSVLVSPLGRHTPAGDGILTGQGSKEVAFAGEGGTTRPSFEHKQMMEARLGQVTEALSMHDDGSTRPGTRLTGASGDSSSEEEDAPGQGAVFRAYPAVVNFGQVPAGCVYRYKVTILNAGVDYSKYRIRQPKLSNVSVVYTPCQVAAGMSVVVWVEISAGKAGETIKDSFSVLSEVKGDMFQVPIHAKVTPGGDALPQMGTVVDEQGQVEVVQQIAKTITLSQLRDKPPAKETGSRLLRKNDGSNLGGTLHEVQATGKNVRKHQESRRTGVPMKK